VTREALDQHDRVVIGTDRGLRLRQRNGKFCERAAAPAQRDSCTLLCAVDVKNHFFDKTAQELLAIAVGGGGRRPHPPEIRAQREELLALFGSKRARALALAQGKLSLGLGQLTKRFLPVALKAARDQAVLGLDLAVAALGPLCLIARPLDLKPPRASAASWSASSISAARSAAFTPAGVSSASSAPTTACSIRPPPMRMHQLPRFSTRSLLGQ
jgi:hypothetical protein